MSIVKHGSVNRQKALSILRAHVKNQNLFRHCLSVEAVMRTLALHFNANQEKWALAGLLHDADWEETKDDPSQHTRKTIQWAKDAGFDDKELFTTILSHNHAHNGEAEPKNIMEWSLYICDDLTGLIVATTLIMLDRKLSSVTVPAVLKKFGTRSFASGVDREHISLCTTKLQISLDRFIGLAIRALQDIAPELGL
ncbi:MAG TPA: HD domain-containing protein [Patescibacteria group bacterium]|nr:HD domain-containing protein [Patescibacteria group bacterium]